MEISVTFDERILTDLVRRAVVSAIGVDPGVGRGREPRVLGRSVLTAPASNASVEESLASLQANLNKLDSRLDEICELVAGRTKQHLDLAEVAEMTGRSAYTIRRWISVGKLKAARAIDTGERGRLLIQRDQLLRVIDAGLGENL